MHLLLEKKQNLVDHINIFEHVLFSFNEILIALIYYYIMFLHVAIELKNGIRVL